MALAREDAPRMSAEAFLDWHELQEKRYELIDGVPSMMAGAARRHNLVAGNASRGLANRLSGSGCIPFQSDMAVAVADDRIRYPDVVVDCDNRGLEDRAAADPRLIVEVLSQGTQHLDVRDKLEEYRALPSIRYILFVSTRFVEVEFHERRDNGWAMSMVVDPDARIALPSLAISLPVAELYENLDLPLRSSLRAVDG